MGLVRQQREKRDEIRRQLVSPDLDLLPVGSRDIGGEFAMFNATDVDLHGIHRVRIRYSAWSISTLLRRVVTGAAQRNTTCSLTDTVITDHQVQLHRPLLPLVSQ